jgi:hypothetical protein
VPTWVQKQNLPGFRILRGVSWSLITATGRRVRGSSSGATTDNPNSYHCHWYHRICSDQLGDPGRQTRILGEGRDWRLVGPEETPRIFGNKDTVMLPLGSCLREERQKSCIRLNSQYRTVAMTTLLCIPVFNVLHKSKVVTLFRNFESRSGIRATIQQKPGHLASIGVWHFRTGHVADWCSIIHRPLTTRGLIGSIHVKSNNVKKMVHYCYTFRILLCPLWVYLYIFFPFFFAYLRGVVCSSLNGFI